MAAAPVVTVRRILLVDDDRALRHVLATLLKEAGHLVESAGDGPEARRAPGRRHVRHRAAGHRAPEHERARGARPRPRPPIAAARGRHDAPTTRPKRCSRPSGDRRTGTSASRSRPTRSSTVVDEAMARRRRRRCRSRSCRRSPNGWSSSRRARSRWPIASSRSSCSSRPISPRRCAKSVAQAFRELLTNAIEWGGKLDPNRKVRISCVRAKRMLLYRIADPGEGFDIDALRHAAIIESRRRSDAASGRARGAGPSARRVRPGDDAIARRRADLQRGAERSDLVKYLD